MFIGNPTAYFDLRIRFWARSEAVHYLVVITMIGIVSFTQILGSKGSIPGPQK